MSVHVVSSSCAAAQPVDQGHFNQLVESYQLTSAAAGIVAVKREGEVDSTNETQLL